MSKRLAEAGRAARHAKAAALSDITSGKLSVVEAVRQPPVALSAADLWDVLLCAPGLGRESVRRVCERAGVWPHERMAGLTIAQRESVVRELPRRAAA